MEKAKKIIKFVFFLSLSVYAFSWLQKDRLPDSADILPSLSGEPVQEEADQESFVIRKAGFTAKMEPMYSYEISGLVVEDYDSEVWHDIMHKNFDPFNTKDLCLVWGENLENDLYKKMDFRHGEFTCFFQAKDKEAYRAFDQDKISNNHLVPADEHIYEKIKQTSIGDQVRIKGLLVASHITTPEGRTGSRVSSVRRTDTGNGACEVIYVSDYDILKKGNPIYAVLNGLSFYAIIGSIFLTIFLFFYDVSYGWRRPLTRKPE